MLGKKNKTETTATSIQDNFNELVATKLAGKAEIVLNDFIRKNDERQKLLASLRNTLKEANTDLENFKTALESATKVTGSKGSAQCQYDVDLQVSTIADIEAEIKMVEALVTAATVKRDSFIEAFDTNAYDALANTDLVRKTVMAKIS